jgi:hypothetical protein
MSIAAIVALSILGILCLGLSGFCVWFLGGTTEKLRLTLEKEQAFRLAEREASFRRERFLITMLVKSDPQLADALSRMTPEEKEPDVRFEDLAGVGEVLMSGKRP